ncbi:signal transduction histidine kinase [Opitutaceae bacterium TAV1]|nr:signal transduction histidine kinase [Opitutaceae bacterium TAV1]
MPTSCDSSLRDALVVSAHRDAPGLSVAPVAPLPPRQHRVLPRLTGDWEWEPLTGLFTWSASHATLFGLPARAFQEDFATLCLRLHPHDRPGLETALTRSRDRQTPFLCSWRVRWPDGSLYLLKSAGRFLAATPTRPPRLAGTSEGRGLPPEPLVARRPLAEELRLSSAPSVRLPYPAGRHVAPTLAPLVCDPDYLVPVSQTRVIEERYQMIFQQMSDGFALFEGTHPSHSQATIDDFRLVDANPAAERNLGRLASDCIGKTLREILPDIDHELLENLDRVVSTGADSRCTVESRSLGKHFSILAFRPGPGQLACIFQDVTERKQLEAQFLQAQKMEVVGQLASGVAHDYNNILTSTLLLLGMLLGDPGQPRHMTEALKELEGETRRAARLTRQLLAFSRKQPAQVRPVDLHELLSHLFTMLSRLLGEHIRLEFRGDSAPLWIEADAGMIEQVVINLCINARDAMMPAGGLLAIETTTAPASALHRPAGSNHPAWVRLSVSDTGCGMDDSTLHRIFEPFFTTKGRQHGTGLGLVTVQSIVRQHHGWIDVRSRPGEGSTFDVFLPAIPSAAPLPDRRSPREARLHGSETILLVEDETSVRSTAAASLRAHGYRVIEADDAASALRCWRQSPDRIDLLLTDMVMPCGVSGMELALQLAREQPALKIIVSSGYNMHPRAGSDLPAMNDCYLPKPYDIQTLLTTVRQHLDQP